MREHLIAFIRAVAVEVQDHGHAGMYRLDGYGGTDLTFGYQYADPGMVIVETEQGDTETMSIEDGVDKFLRDHGLSNRGEV